ncbi:hypothetical protein CHLNCDRAFT_58651 [Chlorella variabilis]|uniref:PHD-type domain-containing protein n=1 Tax=Chlorella variabilis TaxID=554065 RepID=E1ZLG2_CHLVA|nr:hypothetical protein CHLNCDRAFT_58651 [Chlorella variabilis]EFN53262.1 hypothetical protein CHLNCDRAFT_58651 [Chlorella variabilis]|eukprot:XP_005845364.1 hypothetical protein CHLNCDRAFT_58651 [Chlorella variabilis]
MSALEAVQWLVGEDATFEEALTAGRDVRAAAVAAGKALPPKDLSRLYPSTMQDAVSVVHVRLEENKKKVAQSKQKSKSKSGAPHSPSESHFPGARAGGGDPSAFWMYIEDYFRDFNQEDLRGLLPMLLDPRDDPALKVPPCGRRLEDEQQQQRRHAQAKAAAEAARAAAVAAATRGGSEWDTGAVDSRPSGGLDGSPDAERRSSRLVSRHCKEEELRRQEHLEAQAAAAATVAEQAEAAAAAAAARAMAVVPTTSSGAPAGQLLDVLPEQRLAMLVQQLAELMQLGGLEPLSADGDAAVQASLARLQSGASSNGGAGELDAASRAGMQEWLRQRLAPLADELGCSLRVLPPWAQTLEQAGREAAGRDAAAAARAAAGGRQEQEAPGEETAAAAEGVPAAELPEARLATAAYLHPYTELVLRHAVQPHTMQQAVEVPAPEVLAASRQATAGQEAAAPAAAEGGASADGGDPDGAAGPAPGEAAPPGVSLLTATPGSVAPLPEVPSAADLPSLPEQQQQLPGSAAAGEGEAAGAADMAGLGSLEDGSADPAAAGTATPGDGGGLGAGGGEGPPASPAAGGAGGSAPARPGGRARGVSNYALLAGKKSSHRSATGPPKKAVRTAAARPEGETGPQHPVAKAVAALIAGGEPDAPAAEQWRGSVERCPGLLAAAPEDEVLAEMLALQSELMQQAAINRARLVPALAGVLAEAEERRAAAAQRVAEEEEVKAWILKVREIKRQQHRQRREQAHAEAQAAKKQSIMASPRPVLGRQRGSYQAEYEGEEEGREGSPALQYTLAPNELYDVLAHRDNSTQEAFCAVCGDGRSEPPNPIVFCERCDVAVHQHCYGIGVLPEGDWLCEPCREHEERLRAQGVAPAAIRPPSWETTRAPLEGGSRSCSCALCPIKYGAFKKAEDGRRWVHSACALWIPETFIGLREVPGAGRQEYVGGLDKVKAERWEGRCAICGLTGGAVLACQQPGGCPTAFHVLCARNIGLYTAVRPDPARKSAWQYRVYCALHSKAQKDRDERLLAERLEKVAAAQQKEGKAKAAERMSAAKQALAAQEGERYTMYTLRANLETCRMLIDVTKRRERLKKQLVTLQQQEWWQLRQQDPQAALAWLHHTQQRRRAEAEAAAATAAAQHQREQQEAAALRGAPAAQPGVTPPPSEQMQQLPQFAMPLPQPPMPPQQYQQYQQQQQQQAMLAAAAMGGLPTAAAGGGVHFMPPPHVQAQLQAPPHMQQHTQAVPAMQQQQQAQQQQQLQAQQQQTLQQQMLPMPQAHGAPSFAVDMFAPHQFFMQQQQQQQQAMQQQPQQPMHLPRPQMQPGAAAAAFLAMPLQLAPPPRQQLMHGGGQQLPATAAGMLVSVPGGGATAAQVPADVAAAMFGPPGAAGAMPGMAMHLPPHQQAQLAGMDPAVAAALQAAQPAVLRGMPVGGPDRGPSPRHAPHAAVAAAAAAAGATAMSVSPQPSAGGGGGLGRPKRAAAAAAHPASAKRQRAGSEDASLPAAALPAAAAAAPLLPAAPGAPPVPPPADAGGEGGSGGAAAAAGRRQRVASAKVRDNLLQRERQMTAEEAEALNARLPGPLRYLPAAELEAALGSPGGRGGGTPRAGGAAPRQPKPRGKAGGGGGGGV